MSTSQIENGIGATLALAAARRYIFLRQDYSIWCIVGGLAAMEATSLGSYLPSSLSGWWVSSGYSSSVKIGELFAAVLGGLSLEMAVNGGIKLSEFTTFAGLEVFATGVAASLAGIKLAQYINSMISGDDSSSGARTK